jgi:hypothetical protein
MPGTFEYMPPEAQGGSVTYNPSLDVFSFGHLALVTILQKESGPLLSAQYVDTAGRAQVQHEVERRATFIKEAKATLPSDQLMDSIKECLDNNRENRPCAEQLGAKLQKASADLGKATNSVTGQEEHMKESAEGQKECGKGNTEGPFIRGADIISKTKVDITPNKALTYPWEGHGFKVRIPADAVSTDIGPVTMSIQASLSGKYHLPADGVLVSGIYWVALHPTLKKRFDKKVTVYIKHCASVADSALSFITAKCTEEPPYTFKSLPAKIFSESKEGTIEVDHFSSLAIKGRKHSISDYAFCTFYIQKQLNIYEAHITVTPNSRLQLKGVTKKYEGKEEGPRRNACVTETEVSLNIHKNTWEKDGWEVTLLLPPTLKKKDLDGYKRGKIIPHFSMRLKLQHSLNAQSLVQEIGFAGVEPQTFFIAILRDPLPEQASETKGKTHSQPANLCINDLAAVKTELLSVTARWRQIGEVLELAPPKLEVIAAENSDLEICLSKVLSQWLNKAYNTERLGEPSWKLLARVVANPAGGDNPALAQQITGRYGGAEHS